MKIKDYLKERKAFFLVLSLAVAFCVLIVWSSSDGLTDRAYYLLEGLGGLCMIYIVVDYFTLRGRVAKIRHFFRSGATETDSFSYPLDVIYTAQAANMAEEYRRFKAKASEQYSMK